MKTKITLLALLLFFGYGVVNAQQDQECMTNLSIFSEYAKAKNYDAAYEPWMKVRNKCPKLNRAIYTYGEDILEHKIENSTGGDKMNYINDLVKLWGERGEHFASKTPKGEAIWHIRKQAVHPATAAILPDAVLASRNTAAKPSFPATSSSASAAPSAGRAKASAWAAITPSLRRSMAT